MQLKPLMRNENVLNHQIFKTPSISSYLNIDLLVHLSGMLT